jgi:hypothetical protein
MNWADRPSKKNEPSAEIAEVLLDTLTCAFIYIESIKRFQQAVADIEGGDDKEYAKASALAWERACNTTAEMLNKSLKELVNSNEKFSEVLTDRWETTEKIIASSIPVIALMRETEEMENKSKNKENNDE